MARLSIDVLGPLRVTLEETPLTTLESAKVRALLAFLAVEADRPHSRASLIGLLWPDYPEESARHNLRQALFNLRLMLGDHNANPPYLLITRDSIQFNHESDYSLDVDRLNHYFFTCEENLPQCAEDCSKHASNLEQAVKLYRGEFLQHLIVDDSNEFEEWVLVQRESMHQRIIEAHAYLANYYELQADFQAARRHAARQLELDPWREEAHRQMMRVLALDGQRSAALAQYETCKKVLAEELDVEPAEETRELYEQIKLDKLSFIPNQLSNDLSTPVNNLPIQLTPFIGREAELLQLEEYITDPQCRFLTLVGPGGIGKTRLAVQAVMNHLDGFAQGVAFISLAPVGSTQDAVIAIANAINFTFYGQGDPKAYLLNHLHNKQMLLIMDNAEHLLTEDAQHANITQLILEILHSAPGVKFLVTTREALNMQEECIFEVQGLAYPQATDTEGFEEFDAVALFVQRARRAFPRFVLNSENRAEVALICRLVEGMPLAIELAATWMRVLSPIEIAHEIENSLDFLSSSVRDLPERHRSMRAVFDYSWQMLSADEQQVLRKLSTFRGGFQRQAAEQVAGATLSILSTLVNRTMLRRMAAGRYDLHDLVRQYCATKLAADPQAKAEAQRRHFDFYLSLAETADRELKGRNQLDWLGRLEQDHDNLRVALEWALENDAALPGGEELSLRLSAALRWFWRMRGHFHEGRDWLLEALKLCPERRTPARASALLGISLLMNGLGDLGAARSPADESTEIYRELGDLPWLAEALMVAGLTNLWQGEAALGHSQTREALEIYRKIGDRWGEAHALYRLGTYLADYSGDIAGRAMLDESAAILEDMEEKYLYTSVLISLGIVDMSQGDYSSAIPRFERGLVATRKIRHPWGIADALTNLGCIFRIQGEYAQAQARFDEALQVYHEHGPNIWQTDVLCAMAENAIAQGDFSTAHLRLKAASSIIDSSDNKWLQALVIYFKGMLAYFEEDTQAAAKLLGEAVQIARQGQFMPDLARSLVAVGRAKLRLGEIGPAKASIYEGLGLFTGFRQKLGIVNALEALANASVADGDDSQAVMLFSTAHTMRQEMGAPLHPIEQEGHENALAECRAQLGEDEFTDSWSRNTQRPFNEVVEELLKPFNR